VPLAGHGLRPTALRRRASRPQLKRDPLGRTLPAGVAVPTVPPPILSPQRPHLPRAGGGPPSPPVFWRGNGGGGGRWPRWKVLLLFLLSVAVALCCAFALWKGALRLPASVVAGLLVVGIYWWRSRPLESLSDSNSVPPALLWAGAAGALAFLLTHLALPDVPWGFLIMGSLGLGGAAGLVSWALGNLLVLAGVAAYWLIIDILRRGGGSAA